MVVPVYFQIVDADWGKERMKLEWLLWESQPPIGAPLSCLWFPGGSDGKESACNAGDLGLIPESGRSPGEGMATHSNILAWRIPRTEEPGGLPSTGSQRIGHDWATSTFTRKGRTVLNYSYLCLPNTEKQEILTLCRLQRWYVPLI